MPELIVLVGLPASGKSTFQSSHEGTGEFVYSTDRYIETTVNEFGYKSYDEAFASQIGPATKTMNEALTHAIRLKQDIWWDQTNMTAKKRRSILSQFPAKSGYKKSCFCIAPPRNEEEWAELRRRLHSRPGKTIPWHVVESMFHSYVEPSLSEGFYRVVIADIYGNIIKDEKAE